MMYILISGGNIVECESKQEAIKTLGDIREIEDDNSRLGLLYTIANTEIIGN